jgi:hypothetical protein
MLSWIKHEIYILDFYLMHDLYLLCKSLLHRDANANQVHGTLSKSLLEVLALDSQIAPKCFTLLFHQD